MIGEFKGLVKKEVKREWLIWSIEHNGWWRPNESGYTTDREGAGRYTFEDACRIVKSANIGLHDVPNEAMIEFIPSE